jgi:hypothetical protein
MKDIKDVDKLIAKIRRMLEKAGVDNFIVAVGIDRDNDSFDVIYDGYFSREFITTLAHNLIADLVNHENETYDEINEEESHFKH